MPAIYLKMQPLNRLAVAINQGTNNNFSHVQEIASNDEIADLSRKFNQMVDSINLYINKSLEHEQNENKMKYSLLISQIDPHFIYNTMSIINSLAREKRTEDIVEINTALILILQDRLRIEGIEVYDSVKQETDMVRQYLMIQKYRYNNQVNIIWDIDDDIISKMIPKNILQPIVENALFHGLMDEYSGFIEGEITIRIGHGGDGILIQVHDNGRGIPPEVIMQLEYPRDPNSDGRGKRVGIRNIKERLAYLYPRCNCLKIENDHGTTVTISLPENV
jgi:sensor histidine kinase YesM